MLETFLAERLEPVLAGSWQIGASPIDRALAAVISAQVGEGEIVVRLAADSLPPAVVAGDDDATTLRLAFHMQRRQGAVVLQSAGEAVPPAGKVDRALVRAIVLARRWAQDLERGAVASISALAAREGLCSHYTARLLPLAYLAARVGGAGARRTAAAGCDASQPDREAAADDLGSSTANAPARGFPLNGSRRSIPC